MNVDRESSRNTVTLTDAWLASAVLACPSLAACDVTGTAPPASLHTGMTCKCGTSGPQACAPHARVQSHLMCGRFASSLPPDEIRRIFATLGETPNLAPSWNVAPTQSALVVRRHPETGERRLDALTWGFIPWHEKDPKGGRKPINARAETIATSGMFRGAFQARRCLVPMDAFYEWETTPTGKQPWAFARADGTLLALAGLWESWKAPDGEVRRTFTIATTRANRLLSRIHDRMPVILERDAWPVWLGEETGDVSALLRPSAEDVLRSWPVSRDVNSPRHNRADLLERVALPTSPEDDGEAGPDPE